MKNKILMFLFLIFSFTITSYSQTMIPMRFNKDLPKANQTDSFFSVLAYYNPSNGRFYSYDRVIDVNIESGSVVPDSLIIVDLYKLVNGLGLSSDVIVAAGASGSVNSKLRRMTQDLSDLLTAMSDIDLLTGKEDTLNSTTTALIQDSTFTGEWVNTLAYAQVNLIIQSDKASATDGFIIQWSGDSLNVDSDDKFTISANTGKIYSFGTAATFYRVIYTNGGVNQGFFRLYSNLKPTRSIASAHRVEDDLSGQDDAELNKSILAAKLPSGAYANIDATAGGNLKVSVEEFNGSSLGQEARSSSLPVTMANDQPNIQVDIDSPSTGPIALAKAEGDTAADGDVGIVFFGQRQNNSHSTADDGEYMPLSLSEHGCLNVDPQHYIELDGCNATTGWTEIDNDTDNLTTDNNHVFETASLEFDKVDGAAGTIFAGIQKTLASFSINKFIEEGGGYLLGSIYLSDIAEVAYVFIRMGSDSVNYSEWRVSDEGLTAGTWNALRGTLRAPYGTTGTGLNTVAMTYYSIGVAFDAQDDTLADILVDGLFINSGLQTASDIESQVTTSSASPNVKINGYSGSVSTGSGVNGAGVLRVTLPTDQADVPVSATEFTSIVNLLDSLFTSQEVHQILMYSDTTSLANLDTLSRHISVSSNDLGDRFDEWYSLSITADSAIYVSTSASFTDGVVAEIEAGESFTSEKYNVDYFPNWYVKKVSALAGTTKIRVFAEGQ